jgi:hypothetical protein
MEVWRSLPRLWAIICDSGTYGSGIIFLLGFCLILGLGGVCDLVCCGATTPGGSRWEIRVDSTEWRVLYYSFILGMESFQCLGIASLTIWIFLVFRGIYSTKDITYAYSAASKCKLQSLLIKRENKLSSIKEMSIREMRTPNTGRKIKHV